MKSKWLLSFIIAMAVTARDPSPTPIMRVVEPATATANDVVTVTGDNLGKGHILEVYLTDRQDNTKVEVLEQSNMVLKFRVPDLKAGRYWLMVLANLAEPVLIEEPCRITIAVRPEAISSSHATAVLTQFVQ